MLSAVVSLVGDSNTAPAGLPTNTEFADVNGTLYFTASTVANGLELWKSDGTTEGTVRVSDIQAGPASSRIKSLTNVNGTLYFSADDGVHGQELWKSDGTTSGTVLVKDLNPGRNGSGISDVVNSNGSLLFLAGNVSASSIFKSDGTENGTDYVGSATPFFIRLDGLVAIDDVAYVVARNDFEAVADQIWRTDGTSAGTIPVTALPSTPKVQIRQISGVAGRVFFEGYDPERYSNLWTIDDSQIGAHIVNPSQHQSPNYVTELQLQIGPYQYFTDNRGFWRSDGTTEGTTLISDTYPLYPPVTIDGDIYISANGELRKTEGTRIGTRVIGSPSGLSIGELIVVEGKLFGSGFQGNHLVIWSFDRTSETFSLLTPSTIVVQDFTLPKLVSVGARLFFAGNDGIHGNELWTSNGNLDGTFMLKDIRTGTGNSSPLDLVNVGGTIYFSAANNRNHEDRGRAYSHLWRTVSGDAGTEQVLDYPDIGASSIVDLNGTVLFTAATLEGVSFWTVDGKGVHTVGDSRWIDRFSIRKLKVAGNAAYGLFPSLGDNVNSGALWRTDGTAAGTTILHQFQNVFSLRQSAAIGDVLYFEAVDGIHGNELWKSDGTPDGTVLLADLTPGEFGSYFQHLTAASDRVFFSALDSVGVSDGTTEGTRILQELTSDLGLRSAVELASIADIVFMSIYSPATGYELFKTKGTLETTSLVKDISPGDSDSRPRNLTNLNGKLMFMADEPAGRSLWKSDGTPEGTQRLHQFGPVADPNAGQNWSVVDNKVMFTVLDPTTGLRHIWVSDGTVEGTLEIPTHFDETLVIDPTTTFTKYGDGIAFAAATESVGSELFRIDTTMTMMPPASMGLNESAQRTDVSWGDVPGAIQYDVWMQNLTNPSAPIIRKRVNDPKVTLVDSSGTNIANDLQTSAYRMWVRSLPVVGEPSAWSAPKEIVLGPTPLMHSMAASSTNRTPAFQWAGSAGTVSYELWVDNNDSKTRAIFQQGLTKTSFAVTTPLDPARYSAWVRGTRADGTKTNWSPVSNFTIFAAPIVLTSGGGESLSGQPSLAWAAVAGATGYDVQITAAGSNSILYRANNVQGTAHALKNGLATGQYKVYVRANKGSQPLSTWGSGNDLQVKLPPTGLVRTGSAIAGNVGVAWNAVPLAVSYTIELINTFTGTKVQADQTQTSTTLNPTPALPVGQYAVRVRSNFATGAASNWSPAFAFDALRSVGVTITSSSAATADATPTITWTASPDATGYEIFVSRLGSSAAVYTRSGITTTSHRVDVPLTSTIHRIWVRPTFADGSRGIWGPGQQIQIGPAPVITRTTTGFSWSAINAATQYEFWLSSIDPTAGVRRVLYDAKLVATSYTLPTGFPKGRYQLWVRAIRSEAGTSYLGNWGTTGTFDLA